MKATKRILIVDHHPFFREGLARLRTRKSPNTGQTAGIVGPAPTVLLNWI
jgi:DNA-binding NarL/FixJ family response regulator